MECKEDGIPLLDKNEAAEDDVGFTHSVVIKGSSSWVPVDSFQHSFNPSIEGLRGIAVTLTMFCHIPNSLYYPREVAGNMGVSIFLVLSGFLITAVLIRLQSQSSSTLRCLGRFYTDRFFRLTPALILVVALIYPMHYRAEDDMAKINRYAFLALTYLSNWPSLRPNPNATGPWGNTWSLAVEEQFYIIWAIALPFILPRATRIRVFIMFGSMTILYSVFRIYASMYDESVWGLDWRFGLFANVWKMLAGASLRLIPSPPWLLRRIWAYIGLVGFAITFGCSYLTQPDYNRLVNSAWGDGIRPLLAWADLSSVIFTSLLLCGISGAKGGLIILELHPLRFLGRVSYSWYLWQVPVIELNFWRRGYPAVGDTAIALVMAMISTLYVEEPVNQAYKNWKGRREAVKVISPA